MKQVFLATAALTIGLSATARADDVFTDDVIVSNNLLCVGFACASGEAEIPGARSGVKIKATALAIRFDDTSTIPATLPDRDWQLNANEVTDGGQEAFYLTDVTAGTNPFWVQGNAPDNALYVDTTGRIGLGTSMPQGDLHVTNNNTPTMRLEQAGSSFAPQTWDIAGNEFGFFVSNVTTSRIPFLIEGSAPTDSLRVAPSGNLGLGTDSPDAPLELSGTDSFNFFRITATGAATNDSVDIVFTEGPLGTGQLRYNIVDGDNQEMSLDADGNMVLDGTITTAGSCSVGCDAVFDPGYDLPSIEEHHARTLALGHLPNVGPTREGMPVDLADKLGRVLNELEHAHLFIAQQQDQIVWQQDEIAAIKADHAAQVAALAARLDALENR